MLNPPEDLDPAALAATLTREWGVAVASMTYRPLGFGSHHWSVGDNAGESWFATVDDLHRKRYSARDTDEWAYDRLRSALDAARGLHEAGAAFVVAPLTTAGGEPLARLGAQYAVTLYPLVTGDSFAFGEYDGDGHRRAVLDMVVGVHSAPPEVRDRAPADDHSVWHRDALDAAIEGVPAGDCGPYADRAAGLFAEHAGRVRELLARYDDLAAGVEPARAVLTHGEPHSGNTMRTPDGWRLIDWETALISQPERDLWILGEPMQAAYADATGITPRPDLLAMYRLRWDIVDLALEADRFRRPHTGSPDDEASFAVLRRVLASL